MTTQRMKAATPKAEGKSFFATEPRLIALAILIKSLGLNLLMRRKKLLIIWKNDCKFTVTNNKQTDVLDKCRTETNYVVQIKNLHKILVCKYGEFKFCL